MSAAEAVRAVKRGDRIFIGSGAGDPRALVRALADRADTLADVELLHFHPLGDPCFVGPQFRDRLRVNAFFVSDSIRQAVADCEADYTPVFLSQLPALFRDHRIPVDLAFISVSPPDEHGYCSLGVSVGVTRAAMESARKVVAQVNPKMPRTLGGALVHVREIDVLVEAEEELPELPEMESDETLQRIAAHISRLVPDGATIQVGAGRIPNAVIPFLEDRRDLGIHTEVLSDGIMELAKRGVVTGRRKTFHPGKIVASLIMGSRDLYRWVDHNPAIEMHPSDYVNAPANIARNERLIAINSGLEVDLTGQVCAESLGFRFYSGLGGHADFIRGAAMAPDGKPIIALPSTAETDDGVVSRIVPALKEGAGVLTTRGDVHYVVTENGIAYLMGKSIRERAMALIEIAHPDFRQDLLHAAKARRLVFANQIVPPRGAVYPEELEKTVALRDDREVLLRPIRPADEEAMKDLFYSFSEQTLYLRFHAVLKEMPHAKRQIFCNVDYNHEMALAAVVTEEGREEQFVGVGRYMVDEGAKSAEVAFVVRDDWQGHGLGKALFDELATIARSRGLRRFTAEVLTENQAMLRVFRRGGFPMKTSRDAGVIHVEIDITE